eukprot:jgi/Tetstr1/432919/TSEL_022259.t1
MPTITHPERIFSFALDCAKGGKRKGDRIVRDGRHDWGEGLSTKSSATATVACERTGTSETLPPYTVFASSSSMEANWTRPGLQTEVKAAPHLTAKAWATLEPAKQLENFLQHQQLHAEILAATQPVKEDNRGPSHDAEEGEEEEEELDPAVLKTKIRRPELSAPPEAPPFPVPVPVPGSEGELGGAATNFMAATEAVSGLSASHAMAGVIAPADSDCAQVEI